MPIESSKNLHTFIMRSSSSYPGLLALANVVLLVASSILLFLGVSLVTFYKLDMLDFVASWFYVVPYLMMVLGSGCFIVALYGSVVGALGSRCHLYLYAGLMVLFFVLQLAAIFAAMELRGVINRAEYVSIDILADLADYEADYATRAKWDALQREFHCCGGINFNDGFKVKEMSHGESAS